MTTVDLAVRLFDGEVTRMTIPADVHGQWAVHKRRRYNYDTDEMEVVYDKLPWCVTYVESGKRVLSFSSKRMATAFVDEAEELFEGSFSDTNATHLRKLLKLKDEYS